MGLRKCGKWYFLESEKEIFYQIQILHRFSKNCHQHIYKDIQTQSSNINANFRFHYQK